MIKQQLHSSFLKGQIQINLSAKIILKMSHLRQAFEKELKLRISQKSKSGQPEDSVLIKSLKFFDLNNSGKVNRDEFYRAIQKIGVNTFEKQEVNQLFDIYDLEKSGTINIKEFSSIIYANATPYTRQLSPEKLSSKLLSVNDSELIDIIDNLRLRLYDQGITGIIRLAVILKNADKNRNKKLNAEEFANCIHEFGLDLNERQIEKVFAHFDKDGDGLINYDEFISGLKLRLSAYRRSMIEQSFVKLDKNSDGLVDISDMKAQFDSSHHPDVLSGARREKEVLDEFDDSIDGYAYFRQIKNKLINPEEFEEYYSLVGSAIENDQYFGALLNNVWRLAQTAEVNRKIGTEKIKEQHFVDKTAQIINDQDTLQKHIDALLNRFKQRLALRGPRGFNADVDEDGVISTREFQKILRDHRIDITEQDNQLLFAYFDNENHGKISFVQFMHGVVGSLNDFRVHLSDLAWKKFEAQPNGQVHVINSTFFQTDQIDDIKSCFYKLRAHPDVKNGKKTEEQVFDEYNETLMGVHSLYGKGKNPSVDREEFNDFLNYLSAAIEDDKLFELIIQTVFKIQIESLTTNNYAGQAGGRKDYNPRIGYLQDFHRSIFQGGSVSSNAPFGTSEVKDTYTRPSTAMGREKKNDQYAGISTFPGQTQFQDPKKSYEQNLSRQIFNDFRDRLFSRGVRGYFGLLKHLKSIDEKNSGTVDFETFFKTTQDFRFDHNDQELQRLLSYAEAFEDGCVKYLVLIEKLVGNLNEYRRKTVNQFFDRLDKDFKGYLTTDTLYNAFNVKNHPDVRFGKKSEDEALQEFLDTFEIHHILTTGDPKGRDKRVSRDEFLEYYKVVGATIPDDNFFEFVVSNSWVSGGKGQIKGYFNPYYENSASSKKSYYQSHTQRC